MYMLSFNFILGLNFIFFCFELIIIHYHTQKQKKIKFKPRRKFEPHHIHDTESAGLHKLFCMQQQVTDMNSRHNQTVEWR